MQNMDHEIKTNLSMLLQTSSNYVSLAGCDMENINGTALTINLLITCKLKTNLFPFCCWDCTVEMHVSFLPLGRSRKYRELFFIRRGY